MEEVVEQASLAKAHLARLSIDIEKLRVIEQSILMILYWDNEEATTHVAKIHEVY